MREHFRVPLAPVIRVRRIRGAWCGLQGPPRHSQRYKSPAARSVAGWRFLREQNIDRGPGSAGRNRVSNRSPEGSNWGRLCHPLLSCFPPPCPEAGCFCHRKAAAAARIGEVSAACVAHFTASGRIAHAIEMCRFPPIEMSFPF